MSENLINSFTKEVFESINVINSNAANSKKNATILADRYANNFVNTFSLYSQNNKIIYDTFNDLALTIFNIVYKGNPTLVTPSGNDFYKNPLLIASQEAAIKVLEPYYYNEYVNSIGFYSCAAVVIIFVILMIILLSASFTKSIDQF